MIRLCVYLSAGFYYLHQSFCSTMSQSIPNAPREYSHNYVGDNARVQYGDNYNGNTFPDQVIASLP